MKWEFITEKMEKSFRRVRWGTAQLGEGLDRQLISGGSKVKGKQSHWSYGSLCREGPLRRMSGIS